MRFFHRYGASPGPDNGLGVGFTQASYRFAMTANEGSYRGGDGARTTHFEAALDSSGRLTSMRVWVPGVLGVRDIPPDVVTATYSDFCAEVPVALPSGVQPMPDSLYALLNL